MDVGAFNNLVQSQGVSVVHYRAMPDPKGRGSLGDSHGVLAPRESSDGYLFKEVGTMQVFFSNNSLQTQANIEGYIDNASAVITPPQNYEDCDAPVLFAPFDRLFLKDVEIRVVNYQMVEANSTGIDRLQYPATCVEHLVDADGKEYEEGKQFEITKDGNIKWKNQDRPGWNVNLQKGTVYSIRYRYTPYFVIARLLHEIRVTQVTSQVTGERTVERMPYQVLVYREHVLHDVNRDQAADLMDNRLQYAPPVGGNLGSQ
jgi:hypothetical protein